MPKKKIDLDELSKRLNDIRNKPVPDLYNPYRSTPMWLRIIGNPFFLIFLFVVGWQIGNWIK